MVDLILYTIIDIIKKVHFTDGLSTFEAETSINLTFGLALNVDFSLISNDIPQQYSYLYKSEITLPVFCDLN